MLEVFSQLDSFFHQEVVKEANHCEVLFESGVRESGSKDEWQSQTGWHRVVAFNRPGESIADTLHKGDYVLVDGQLVGSKYERGNGKSKKAKAAKFAIFWSVRANSVRRLSRPEAPAQAAAPEPTSDELPF